ncbi:MAG: hypothetical protein H7256_03495 [Bdellovibrio sp.]|nr:hypothetical protein [Bdellovibrio sp.]
MFKFEGPLGMSNSWLNRALILQFYNSKITFDANSRAEDFHNLKQSIDNFQAGKEDFFLGEGGATFRFFSFLVSRLPGQWTMTLHERMTMRPQSELSSILKQLGVEISFQGNTATVKTDDWIVPSVVYCDGSVSSQFISGLLLNSWNLNHDLTIELKRPFVSESYLLLTLDMLKEAGLVVERIDHSDKSIFKVAKYQVPLRSALTAELDVSSAFALICGGAIDGNVHITNWSERSIQPDLAFLKIFDAMKINYNLSGNHFRIEKQTHWKASDQNLINSPDLFPVLSVMAAFAEGNSFLHGASHAKAKESNRLYKTHELLSLCGIQSEYKEDGLIIFGQSSTLDKTSSIFFDPDQDHRMAMAAGLLKLSGFNIQILDSGVVNKSYPQFWEHIEINP